MREELDARDAAKRILEEAHFAANAERTLATDRAKNAIAMAASEAEENERAKYTAAYLELRAREEALAEGELDRSVALAVLLAEHLIGASLSLDPSQIAGLAREALAMARGSRSARIEVHPLDESALVAHITTLGPPEHFTTVVSNPSLSRGSLIVHTDTGILDAQLAPRLERLKRALKSTPT